MAVPPAPESMNDRFRTRACDLKDDAFVARAAAIDRRTVKCAPHRSRLPKGNYEQERAENGGYSQHAGEFIPRRRSSRDRDRRVCGWGRGELSSDYPLGECRVKRSVKEVP